MEDNKETLTTEAIMALMSNVVENKRRIIQLLREAIMEKEEHEIKQLIEEL